MYQEIAPSNNLNNLIDSFWIFSKNEASECFKILPDACTDLIFDLKLNRGFLSGIMSNFQLCKLPIDSNLLAVRFKTEKFGSISKIPLHETKNLQTELPHILPTFEQSILGQLNKFEGTVDRIKFLENFIITTYQKNYHRIDELVLLVATKIRTSKGKINMGDLTKSYNISVRQLQRRFKNYIGLTIKEFSNIVRFKNARKTIRSLTDTSLLEIAFDTGYFDHSHMNYEFNRISGENPSYFR